MITSIKSNTDFTGFPKPQFSGWQPSEREDGQYRVHAYGIEKGGWIGQFVGDNYVAPSLGSLAIDPRELRRAAARTRPALMELERDHLRRGDVLVLSSLADVFSTLTDVWTTIGAWHAKGVIVCLPGHEQLTERDVKLLRKATFSQQTRRGTRFWRLPPNPEHFVGYGLLARYNRPKNLWSFRHDAAARSTQEMILTYSKLNWKTRDIAAVLNISGIRAWGRVCHNSGLARNKRLRWTASRVAIARKRELELREFEREPDRYERHLQSRVKSATGTKASQGAIS